MKISCRSGGMCMVMDSPHTAPLRRIIEHIFILGLLKKISKVEKSRFFPLYFPYNSCINPVQLKFKLFLTYFLPKWLEYVIQMSHIAFYEDFNTPKHISNVTLMFQSSSRFQITFWIHKYIQNGIFCSYSAYKGTE